MAYCYIIMELREINIDEYFLYKQSNKRVLLLTKDVQIFRDLLYLLAISARQEL